MNGCNQQDIVDRLRIPYEKPEQLRAADWRWLLSDRRQAADEIERLRAALAQPKPEPVACICGHDAAMNRIPDDDCRAHPPAQAAPESLQAVNVDAASTSDVTSPGEQRTLIPWPSGMAKSPSAPCPPHAGRA